MTTLSALTAHAPPSVLDAIQSASTRTGVDFDYLVRQAAVESNFAPTAQATTSSARGLYQFIESTWLDLIDRHGADHGLGKEAAAITRNAQGKPTVTDTQQRRDILALRDDPRLSALMAAEYARDNRQHLEQTLGRRATNNDLYLAHFLGPGGATQLLQQQQQQPHHSAATLLPAAARANRAVFFAEGKALSASAVVDRFAGVFGTQGAPRNSAPGGTWDAASSDPFATTEAATRGKSTPQHTARLAALSAPLSSQEAFTTTRPQALLAHTLLRSLQNAETAEAETPAQRWEV